MFDLLIANGNVVLPGGTIVADLATNGEKIAAILPPASKANACRLIDATGLYVIPGGIDAHTHIYFPHGDSRTNDDFETGTVAAAFGGTTTIVDFAIQKRGTSALAAIEERKSEIEGNAVIDYTLHSCLTEATEPVLAEIEDIVRGGIGSFKIYMTYRKEQQMVDDGGLLAILTHVSRFGGLVGVHAENAAISEYLADQFLRKGLRGSKYHALSTPNIVEAEAVHRAIYLARHVGAALYVYHLSTREGTDLISEARRRAMPVYAETCPHYLVLTDEVYDGPDPQNYLVCPPLRKKEDLEALWEGIKSGVISVVASDGIALDSIKKAQGSDFTETPRGLAGVETRLPVTWSEGVSKGRITPEEFVRVVSTNPARILGLYPTKGVLMPGSDADIVLIDPKRHVKLDPANLHMNVDYSVYTGMECIGYPVITISRGQIIVEDGRFVGSKGYGKFVPAFIAPDILKRPL